MGTEREKVDTGLRDDQIKGSGSYGSQTEENDES